ncbi:hypothetical protein CBF68_05470 [Lactobacillus taiwanensis]|uniref:hypothetical protein n=1 Tax=Lactobacillus taiwanensis TaxID=508451 RepID=UPI000B99B8B5|nr:hypothetical protein [Lactobacillus taiwanensis]OYS00306.1 hypothetical protein CBF64_03240 [Lactobacillus taiwanensis]OYS03747.1 hypothetical protein CBF68_05470 [Lactobacillus taiwanensis]
MKIEFVSSPLNADVLQIYTNNKYFGALAFKEKVWNFYHYGSDGKVSYTNNLSETKKLIAHDLKATEIIDTD